MKKTVIHFVGSDSISISLDATLNGQSFSDPEDFCRALLELGEKRNWARLESDGKLRFVNPKAITYISPIIESSKLNTSIS